MDTTEIFGLRIVRFADRLRARRLAPSEAAVHGEPLLPRLKLLAGLIAGRPLEVRLTPDPGGWTGETLLLPPLMDIAADPELNEAAYVYRIAYGATSLRLGLVAGPGPPWMTCLQTLLAVAATRRALHAELPAAAGLATRLHAALRARGRPPGVIRDAPALVEALCWLRLGGESGAVRAADPDLRAWLDAALALDEPDSASIHAFAAALFEAFPRRSLARARPPAPIPLWGELLPAGAGSDLAASEPDAPRRTITKEQDPRRLLGRVERRAAKDSHRSPLFHHFEKIETLQDADTGSSRADESGDPESERQALDQMRPRSLVRSHESSSACYRLDAMLDGVGLQVGEGEAETRLYSYPEWHHRKRRYRRDWCALFELSAPGPVDEDAVARAHASLARHRRRIEAMRRRLEAILLERTLHRRRPAGDEVDLDAAVDRHATLTAGHTPGERLYLERRRSARDLAVWILLDQSLSSDGVLAEAAYKMVYPVLPSAHTMGLIGGLALSANLVCFFLLYRHRGDNLNMSSTWLCSRNDLIANVGVLLAAAGGALLASRWPDIVVGTLIAGLFLRSAFSVLARSIRALRAPPQVARSVSVPLFEGPRNP